MKKRKEQDTLRPEYDFTDVPGVRGKHAQALRDGYTTTVHHDDGSQTVTHYRQMPGAVQLDSDVQAYFPDSKAVNEALRGLIALIPKRRASKRSR